ncbi:RBB1NT (NUC162) domain, partial [Nesidiocoris tenuis]
ILRTGAIVEARHPDKKEFFEATITKVQDCSQYTVVFDDGDITTLRRTALCLKSGKHFAESETLDQLPLTHPEHFSTPVIGGRRGRRTRIETSAASSDEDTFQQSSDFSNFKETDIGRVVCVEGGEKRKNRDNWFPALIVAPTAQESVAIRVRDEYLVRSFKDGRYYTVPKKEIMEFTREMGAKVETNSLKAAVEKALQFIDRDELPLHWDRDLLLNGVTEPGSDSELGDNHDSSDDDEPEKKDHFVAQLYKFMDENGTPINEEPVICNKDVDLFRLYKVVHNLGGFNRVTNQNNWKSVAVKLGFGFNPVVINMVKQSYRKYLLSFEEWPKRPGCAMQIQPRLSRSRSRLGRGSTPKDRTSPKPASKIEKPEGGVAKTSVGGSTTPVSSPATPASQTSINITPEKNPEKPKEEVNNTPTNPKESAKPSTLSSSKESTAPTQSPKSTVLTGQKEKSALKRNAVPTNAEKTPPPKKSAGAVEAVLDANVKPVLAKEIKVEAGMSKVRNPKFKAPSSESSGDAIAPINKKDIKEEPADEVTIVDEVPSNKEKKRRLAVRTPKKEIPLVKGGKIDCLANTRQKRVIKEKAKSIAASIRARTKSSASSIEALEKVTVSKAKIKEEVTPVAKGSKKEEPVTSCPSADDKKRGRKRKANSGVPEESVTSSAPVALPSIKNISLGDKLKVYYGPTKEAKITSYEAKVLSTKEENGETFYFVHYTGWNTRYDEWIGVERIAENLSWVASKSTKKQSQALNPKFRKRPDCKTPQGKDGPTNPPQSLLSKDQAQQNTTGRQGSVGRSTTPSSIASSSSRSKGTPVSKRPQRKAKQNKKSAEAEEFYSDNGSETGDSKNTVPNMSFDNSQSEASPAESKPNELNESDRMLAASEIKQEKMDEDYNEESAPNEELDNENFEAEEEGDEDLSPFRETVLETVKIKTEVEEIDASEYYYYHRSDEDDDEENDRAGISQIVQDSVMKYEFEDSLGSPLLGFDPPTSEDAAAEDASKGTISTSENVFIDKATKRPGRTFTEVRTYAIKPETVPPEEKDKPKFGIKESATQNESISADTASRNEPAKKPGKSDVPAAVEEHDNSCSALNSEKPAEEAEDIYEFKEPEPFEFESLKLSDDKAKTSKRVATVQQSPPPVSTVAQTTSSLSAASSPHDEIRPVSSSPIAGGSIGKQAQPEAAQPIKAPPTLQAPLPELLKEDLSPSSTPTIQTCEEAFDKICASPLRAATLDSRHIEMLERMDNYDEDDPFDDDSEDRLVISERDSDNGSTASVEAKNKDISLHPPVLTPAITRSEMKTDELNAVPVKLEACEKIEKQSANSAPEKSELTVDDKVEEDEDEEETDVEEQDLLEMIEDDIEEDDEIEAAEEDDNEDEETSKTDVKADASESSSLEDEELAIAPAMPADGSTVNDIEEEEIKDEGDVMYSQSEDVVLCQVEGDDQDQEDDDEEETLGKSEEDESTAVNESVETSTVGNKAIERTTDSNDARLKIVSDIKPFKSSSPSAAVTASAAAAEDDAAGDDEEEEEDEDDEEEELDNRSRDEDELKDDVGPADDKANSGEDENNIESLMCEETIPGSPPSHSDLLAMAESPKVSCGVDAHLKENLAEQGSSDDEEQDDNAKLASESAQKTADSAEDENNIESLMCEETIPGSPPSQNDMLPMDEKMMHDPADQGVKLGHGGSLSSRTEVVISSRPESNLSIEQLRSSPHLSKNDDSPSPTSQHQQMDDDASSVKQEIKQERDNDHEKANITPSTSFKKDGNKSYTSSDGGRSKKPEARAPARRGRRAKKKNEDNPRRKYSRQAKHHGSESDDGFDGGNASNRIDPVKNYVPLGRNFLIPQERLAPLESQQRINLLMQAVQDLRNHYSELKTELATLDKRRKRIRRREREQAARLHSSRNH